MLRRTKGYMPEPVAVFKSKMNCDTADLVLHNKSGVTDQKQQMSVSYNLKLLKDQILASGGQMEPGFCLTAGGQFFPAEIPGDISLEKTEQFFADSVHDWIHLLNIKPQAVVADLHPGYASTQWGKKFAEQNGLPFYQVQHHHAHALAVMEEHQSFCFVKALVLHGSAI